MMPRLSTAILTLSSLCIFQSAYALEYGYSHTYEDTTHRNSDQMGISHPFGNVTLGFEIRALAQPHADGTAGNALAHDKIREYHYKMKYRYQATDRLTLTPAIGWDHYHQTERYKTSIGLSYKITPTWQFNTKYRYDYFYNELRNNFDYYTIENSLYQTIGKFGLTYGYDQYYTDNGIMYNNHNTDHKFKFALDYKMTPKFTPYFEIRNESVNRFIAERATNFEAGFSYKFF